MKEINKVLKDIDKLLKEFDDPNSEVSKQWLLEEEKRKPELEMALKRLREASNITAADLSIVINTRD